MKNKIKKFLHQVFLTHLGRIFFLSFPMIIIGGLFSPNGVIGEKIKYSSELTIFDIIAYIGIGILFIESLIMFISAFINTINDFKNK